MKNIAIILIFIAATFAGCGGQGYHGNKFGNEAQFENGVKHAIESKTGAQIKSVQCVKTGETTADCVVSDNIGDTQTVKIECSYVDASGGHDCLWKTTP